MMKRTTLSLNRALVLAIVGLLTIGQAAADKPAGAGEGKGKKTEHSGTSGKGKSDHREAGDRSSRGSDQSRYKAGEYYGEQFRRGHCPPGLAKKNNGCMPPGQAKKWAVGRPLPRDVVYHEVPQALVVQMQQPSAGYRYVRVASDILLIALGTGMVIDAIQDLGRL